MSALYNETASFAEHSMKEVTILDCVQTKKVSLSKEKPFQWKAFQKSKANCFTFKGKVM